MSVVPVVDIPVEPSPEAAARHAVFEGRGG
jgi:hypothetical protein